MAENKVFHFLRIITDGKQHDCRDDNSFLDDNVQDIGKYACNSEYLNEKFGSCYNYFSVKGRDGMPRLMFSKTSLKVNTRPQDSFSQCNAWSYTNVWAKESFDEVFSVPFLDETQVDAYANGDTSVKFEDGHDRILDSNQEKLTIDKCALKAIIAGVIFRWMMSDRQVLIAVPKKEKDYNAYVMRAVREIYSYFPIALKVEAGFLSLLPEYAFREYPRIHIAFLPEEVASEDAILLDGSKPEACDKIFENKSFKMFEGLINHIVEISDRKERKQFLNAVNLDIENKSKSQDKDTDDRWITMFSPMGYREYSKDLEILDANCGTMEMYKLWVDFANSPMGAFPEMEKLILEKIWKELTKEDLKAFTAQKLESCSNAADEIKATLKIAAVCRDRQDFKPAVWECLRKNLTSGKYTDRQAYDALKTTAEKLDEHSDGNREATFLRSSFAEKCSETIIAKANDEIKKIAAAEPELDDYKTKAGAIVSQAKDEALSFLLPEDAEKIEQTLNIAGYDYIAKYVGAELKELIKTETKTPSDIKIRLNELSELIKKMSTQHEYVRATTPYRDLYSKIDAQKRLEEAKRAASASVLNETKDKINKAHERNYFKNLNSVMDLFELLEGELKKDCKEFFKTIRPQRIEDYYQQFEDYYGTRLRAGTLNKAVPAVREIIADDMADYCASTSFELKGNTAEEMLAYATGINGMVSQFTGGKQAKFIAGSSSVDYKSIAIILSQSANDGDKFSNATAEWLIDEGIFSGRNLVGLRNIYETCGVKGQNVLMKRAFAGKFKDTDEATYKRAFEDCIEYLKNNKKIDDLQAWDILEGFKKDCGSGAEASAGYALSAIRKDIEIRNGRKSPVKTAIIIALALLLVGSAIFGILKSEKLKDQIDKTNSIQSELSSTQTSLLDAQGELRLLYGDIATVKIKNTTETILQLIDVVTENGISDESRSAIEKTASDIQAVKGHMERSKENGLKQSQNDAFYEVGNAMAIVKDEFADQDIAIDGLGIVRDAFMYATNADESNEEDMNFMQNINDRQTELVEQLNQRKIVVIESELSNAINYLGENNENNSISILSLYTAKRAAEALGNTEAVSLIDAASVAIDAVQQANEVYFKAVEAVAQIQSELDQYYANITIAEENDEDLPIDVLEESDMIDRLNEAQATMDRLYSDLTGKLEKAKQKIQIAIDYVKPLTCEEYTVDMIIVNSTSATFEALYSSPKEENKWGEDFLCGKPIKDKETTATRGFTITYNKDSLIWDLRAVEESGWQNRVQFRIEKYGEPIEITFTNGKTNAECYGNESVTITYYERTYPK